MMKKALALLSGGLDSTVSLVFSKSQYNVQLILTIDYGQKAADNEMKAATKIAQYLNIPIQIVNLPWLGKITNNPLVQENMEVPHITLTDVDQNGDTCQESAAKVWVPNRNGVFLNIAASFAEAIGMEYIIFGGNKEEASTFPDNSQEFIDSINHCFTFSTLSKVKVVAPVAHLNKIEMLQQLGHKKILQFIWSCYNGREVHCGECESCTRLKRSLLSTNNEDVWLEKISHGIKIH